MENYYKKMAFKQKLERDFADIDEFKEVVMNVIHDNLTSDAFKDTHMNVGTLNPFSNAEPNEIVTFTADEKYDLVVGLLEEALETLDIFYKEELDD